MQPPLCKGSFLLEFPYVNFCDIIVLLSYPFRQRKGGAGLTEYLYPFLISVMAGVVSYYVCKWLDGDDHDN